MRSAAMRRPVLLGAAWTASAAAAVGLGFLAVSLVDASASPGASPVAATSSTATPTGTTSPSSTAPVSAATGEYPTVAGTVYANCTGGQPVLAGVPVAGWWVDDSSKPGEVAFRNGTQKVEVHVTCGASGPQFSLEGPRADDSGRGDGGTSSSNPASSAASPSADDSSGRDGGGHGSDDPPGDDSSGRGGGGHGSDD
jgi:hypothetical protein